MLSRRVLSKEEETQTPDAEVTKQDQDKINTFSRLHNKIKDMEDLLQQKQKDKEDLTDLCNELLLVADETEKIMYKVGDGFFAVSVEKATKLVEEESEEVEKEVEKLEREMEDVRGEIDGLKAHLYARFGRGINLES